MSSKILAKKCPKCGELMVIKETKTFDETIFNCNCKRCNYSITYSIDNE